MVLNVKEIDTDVLIIGAGAAGCYLAIELLEKSNLNITIVDKGFIKRSGCLAAGVNALNAYIVDGETEEGYVDYVSKEFKEIVREDLLLSVAKNLNAVTKKIESMGLTILKDENGNYVSRGKRSIKINGENIKPILYNRLKSLSPNILEGVNITDYILEDNAVLGGVGFSLREDISYVIKSKVTVCATGGASGIYRPTRDGKNKHKMWYSPFNTGAGYSMGIRAGAEMTSLEMRFIALRCKDTIAPTGTIAQGIGARQVNLKGEHYAEKYGEPTTDMRLYSTIQENKLGNGPCYLETKGISEDASKQLFKAYLNMAPMQVLKWVARGESPSTHNVEIDGTEPYIVGGHSGSGYWVDNNRKTTLKNLYAIGDVSGGSPKKYVTGCFAEGKIASESIIKDIGKIPSTLNKSYRYLVDKYGYLLEGSSSLKLIEEAENRMQNIMDSLAGGKTTHYEYNEKDLNLAIVKLNELSLEFESLRVSSKQHLLYLFEVRDRLLLAKGVINHMLERKETRWRSYGEFKDYRNISEEFNIYINSIYRNNKFHIIRRNLIKRNDEYVY
ncbi:MAG: adenylyl-sulfate reductase subunit alpha [Clostridium sp.]|uniref:adenylyl-sulfate reductase subunit alpha n=1 Tax=Clostridium sp. TaxID=1506 RepID=UPI002FC96BC2